MSATYQPLAGSRIEVADGHEGPELRWMNRSGSLVGRIGSSLFLMAWLGGWTVGGLVCFCILLTGKAGPFGTVFLSCWLVAWFVGETHAIRSLVALLSRPKPERLRLDSMTFMHDPGTPGSLNPFSNRSSKQEQSTAEPRLRHTDRSNVGKVCLDRVGERQRLTVDLGTERVEVGHDLDEPEREWLHEVLLKWKEAAR